MVVKNIIETIKERLDSGGKIKDLYWDESYSDFERKLVARAGEKYRPHWYYPFKVEAEEDMYKEGILNSKIVPISSIRLGSIKYVDENSKEILYKSYITVSFEGDKKDYTEYTVTNETLYTRLKELEALLGPLDEYNKDEDDEDEEDYDYEGDLWEYKTLTSLDQKTLTSLGKQGWEMCGIEPTTIYPVNCGPECSPIHGSKYYFKRLIDDEEV